MNLTKQNLTGPVFMILSGSLPIIFILFFIGTFLFMPNYYKNIGTNQQDENQDRVVASKMLDTAFDEFRVGKYNETITTTSTIIEKYSTTASQHTLGTAYAMRGDSKGEMGDHEGALVELEQASVLLPNDKLVWVDLAGRYRTLGYYAKAKECLEKAIGLDQKDLLRPKNNEIRQDLEYLKNY